MESQPPFPPFPPPSPSDDVPVYGPLPPPPRRRIPRAALVGGLTAGLALAGAGIAYASTSSGSSPGTAAASSPTSTTPSSVPVKPGKLHPGRFGFRPGGLGFAGLGIPGIGGGKLLYGQATIQQPDGTTKTIEFQSGTVSAVNGSSITVASGSYSHTYKVDSSTVVDAQAAGISTVGKGDQVELLATQQNGNDTAVNIVDTTKIKSSRSGFGFSGGRPGNPPGSSPTTNPTTGATWGGGPAGPGFAQFGSSQLQ